MRLAVRTVALCAAIISTLPLHAATTLASYTGGTAGSSADYYGQSFDVSGSGVYNAITFNFFSGTGAAVASGTGYLFSSAYTGSVSGLSSASTNLLGTAAASGGLYTFGSNVMLTAGKQYYFYENAFLPADTIAGAVTGSGGGGGNLAYTASSSSPFFSDTTETADFAVRGTSVTSVTPEPSSLALLGTGLLGVIGVARRRFAV